MSENAENWVALLGVKGGPAIRPGSNMPTSLLLQMAGKNVLVDAGLGAARGVCDQSKPLTAIDAIVITHMHSDHYLELGPLLHTAWTAGLKRSIPIFGPAGLRSYWDGFLASMEADITLRIADEGRPDLAGLADIRQLPENEPIWIDDLKIEAMRNDHPPLKETYALRATTSGRSVDLSGDTAFMDAMIDFADGTDLLVHEAMLTEGVDALIAHTPNGDDRLRQHILRSHTDARDVGRIAAEAGVGHLALNHLVPDGLPGFTNEHWTNAVRETWDGPLTLGRDGLRISL